MNSYLYKWYYICPSKMKVTRNLPKSSVKYCKDWIGTPNPLDLQIKFKTVSIGIELNSWLPILPGHIHKNIIKKNRSWKKKWDTHVIMKMFLGYEGFFSPAASIKNPLYIKFELITSRCGLSRDKVDGMCYVSLIFAKQIFSSFDHSFTDEFFN